MEEVDYTSIERSITDIYKTKFILTPFAERFEEVINNARCNKQWGVVGAYARNGKTWCLRDLQKNSGAYKQYDGKTFIPVIAVRSPESKHSADLLYAISSSIGMLHLSNSSALKRWLLDNIPRLGVQQIIIDDAHELNMNHFKFIKWLTDSLELERGHYLSIVLTSIIEGNGISALNKIKQYCGEGWMQQIYERFYFADTIFGLNPEEVYQVLDAMEDIYRPFLPEIQLKQFAGNIFGWLTSTSIDVRGTRRVSMQNLSKLIYEAAKIACVQNKIPYISGELLKYVCSDKILVKDNTYASEKSSTYQTTGKKEENVVSC